MEFTKDELIRDLALLVYLKDCINQTEEYDGFTEEDQTEFFINQNGFEPKQELNKYKEIILIKYCNNIIIEEIKHHHNSKDLDLDRLSKLSEIVNEYISDRTHKKIILELLTIK